MSEVNSTIVRAIISLDFKEFIRRLGVLALFAIPSATLNSMLRFLGNKLALSYRSRLVHYFHDLYMHPLMYYKVSQIDDRIKDPDQALTTTIEDWAKAVSTLYSDVTKPLLDIALLSYRLTHLVGPEGPLSVVFYYMATGIVIRLISPRFGRLTAIAQRLEGHYRHVHNRLIHYSEEIAFYGGHEREKLTINSAYDAIKQQQAYLNGKKFIMGISDGFLTKYGPILLGYSILGLPVFGPRREEYLKSISNDASAITHDYIRNSSLLISLARAIGRIVASYKDVQRLAGYTHLVSELNVVMDDLRKGDYRTTMPAEAKADMESRGYAPNKGKVHDADFIQFDNVPIVKPNGELIREPVNLKIEQGMNVMVVGPNGSGKSSLFRILGELWPMFDGDLYRPKQEHLFYISQAPYLTVGTLRDQVIYPDSLEEFRAKGYTDETLNGFFDMVKLRYIAERPGGWDAIQEWFDVLSGGEKQRVAMARLFYHKPMFAVLDECTSAVSVDVEGFMYEECRRQRIGLVTISHRRSLWKYHDFLFTFDEDLGWKFEKMPNLLVAAEDARGVQLDEDQPVATSAGMQYPTIKPSASPPVVNGTSH